MGSYFGNIQNAERAQLRFDKIYPNKKAMDESLAAGDGVFIGRFVLIEYDDGTKSRRRGYLKDKYGFDQQKCELYADSTCTIPYRLTETDPNTGYGVYPNDLFYASTDNLYNYYFICLNETTANGNALFRTLRRANINETVTDYELNYNVDKAANPDMTDNGFDATVWRKAVRNGKEIYQLIARLNSELPRFYVEEDAPSLTPVAPHLGFHSTNKDYSLHLQSNWGFRIGEAKEPGKTDLDVTYTYAEYNPILNVTEEKTVGPYPADLYYNKAGFDPAFNNYDYNTPSEISLLPTGESGKIYYNHEYTPDNGQDQYITQKDIQELKFHLPEIGNTVASLWNLVYGEGEFTNTGALKRNQDIQWNSTSGIRMVTADPEKGGYLYEPEKTEVLAGCINSVHDLMGMIISEAPEGIGPGYVLNDALPNRIYYGYLDDTGVKKYFYKDTLYLLKSFKNMGWTDEQIANYIGGRSYQDLIQFEPRAYYVYEDNNFYIEDNNTPTEGTPYYKLGTPIEVELLQWQGVDENGDIIYNYYEENGDFIKDTNPIPDIDKTYYSITAAARTTGMEVFYKTLLWNPSNIILDEEIPGEIQMNNPNLDISYFGSGFFYYSEVENALQQITEDSIYDSSLIYYYFDKIIAVKGIDLEGDISESLYLVNEYNELISFTNIDPSKNVYNQYRVKFLDPDAVNAPKYYWAFAEEGMEEYRLLKKVDGKWNIDDTFIYYTIEPGDPLTNTAPEEEESYIHYYRPGLFFNLNENEDYILSTSLIKNDELKYYRITNENNIIVEKDEKNGVWLIDPISEKFYEPNKYYYYSAAYQKDVLDANEAMRKISEDTVDEYIDNGRIYYLLNLAYVVKDESGTLNKGSVWDKNAPAPPGVILGIREESYQWTELTGFAKTLNTIHGLILNVNKMFRFEDEVIRNNTTVAGMLNQIRDITRSFEKLNPGDVVSVNAYGQLTGKTGLGELVLRGYNHSSEITNIESVDTLSIALSKLQNRIIELETKIAALETQ